MFNFMNLTSCIQHKIKVIGCRYVYFLAFLMGALLITSVDGFAEQSSQEQDRFVKAKAYFGDDVLVDQDGVEQRFYSELLADKVVLINVVYTHCKDSCPLQTKKLKQVQKELGDRFGRDVKFLSLSVDPKRDTPASLKEFAAKQGVDTPGWRFLVSEPATMQKVLTKLGQWTDTPDAHSTLLVAGNIRKGHWIKLRPDSPPNKIFDDLMRLLDDV